MPEDKQVEPKQKWNKMYTIVLIANALYILCFYLITNYFS
jgi:hypothetical protein